MPEWFLFEGSFNFCYGCSLKLLDAALYSVWDFACFSYNQNNTQACVCVLKFVLELCAFVFLSFHMFAWVCVFVCACIWDCLRARCLLICLLAVRARWCVHTCVRVCVSSRESRASSALLFQRNWRRPGGNYTPLLRLVKTSSNQGLLLQSGFKHTVTHICTHVHTFRL